MQKIAEAEERNGRRKDKTGFSRLKEKKKKKKEGSLHVIIQKQTCPESWFFHRIQKQTDSLSVQDAGEERLRS